MDKEQKRTDQAYALDMLKAAYADFATRYSFPAVMSDVAELMKYKEAFAAACEDIGWTDGEQELVGALATQMELTQQVVFNVWLYHILASLMMPMDSIDEVIAVFDNPQTAPPEIRPVLARVLSWVERAEVPRITAHWFFSHVYVGGLTRAVENETSLDRLKLCRTVGILPLMIAANWAYIRNAVVADSTHATQQAVVQVTMTVTVPGRAPSGADALHSATTMIAAKLDADSSAAMMSRVQVLNTALSSRMLEMIGDMLQSVKRTEDTELDVKRALEGHDPYQVYTYAAAQAPKPLNRAATAFVNLYDDVYARMLKENVSLAVGPYVIAIKELR